MSLVVNSLYGPFKTILFCVSFPAKYFAIRIIIVCSSIRWKRLFAFLSPQSCRGKKSITAAEMSNLVYINSPNNNLEIAENCVCSWVFRRLISSFFFFPSLRWRPAVCQSCLLFTSQCLDNKLRFSLLLPADLPSRMKGPSRFFSRRSGVGTLSRRQFCHHYRSAGRHRSGPAGGECGGSGRDLFIYLSVFFLATDLSAVAPLPRRRRVALRDPQNTAQTKATPTRCALGL